jgi:holo-[acyl-carrier protein] synthase
MDVFVGTDIESVHRIKNILNRKYDYLNHLFYKNELDYSLKRNNPECTLTGIWCAKEAVLKSMNPVVKLSLHDIEILNTQESHPKVKINKKLDFEYSISVSFAHTKEYATATALFILKS